MQLSPISKEEARLIFDRHSSYRGEFDLAISVVDETGYVHGVIALIADGKDFKLGHLYTDANAQVGTLLYGGAWRTAKALGYRQVWI